MMYPTITLEEHFASRDALTEVKALNARLSKQPALLAKLNDMEPDGPRTQGMDEHSISIQVLSDSYGISSCSPGAVRKSNDQLAAATQSQARFKGFAALPLKHPQEAAVELERCVKELGFLGALIDSHLDDGRYYDDEAFWVVFETAQALDVPVYIHPTAPTDGVQSALYEGNYGGRAAMMLGLAGMGWHYDTALSLQRMYASGLFRRCPRLRIVIGHMGEMLPYMLDRVDEKLGGLWPGEPETSFKAVWERNVWITTSGMFSLAPMACLLRSTSIERILYSVDYPYADNESGSRFLKELEESGLVTDEELAMICYKNAESLLKIKVAETHK